MLYCIWTVIDGFTLKKLECLKQAYACILLHGIIKYDFGFILLVFETEVMIKRDCRGHMYAGVRGEILRSSADKLLRKHLPRMFSLIKNESQRIEDDQIPS